MEKIALVFAGQGSQKIAMTEVLFAANKEITNEFYQRANKVLGYDLLELSKNGPEEKLQLTEFTQPALFTHEVICFEILKNKYPNLNPEYVLGHSVGEYAALYACGFFSFEDGLKATQIRGQAMQNACKPGLGTMYAILKLGSQKILEACQEVSKTNDEVVVCANFNTEAQTVISGHNKACEKVVEKLKDSGEIFRAIQLKVSAPFHSPLMKPAEETLSAYFSTINLNNSKIKIIANIDAKIYETQTSAEVLKNNLIKQVSGSVQWVKSVEKIPNNYKVIELGPGKTLKGMIKKIKKELEVFAFEDESDLKQIQEILK